MNPERIDRRIVSSRKETGKYVLYWMQQSQRINYNHALLYAMESANKKNLPLLVYFGLTDDFPEANERHYTFMLEGIQTISQKLNAMGVEFLITGDSPEEGIRPLLKDAAEIIMDKGYLRIQRQWREKIENELQKMDKSFSTVESDVVVPIHMVSQKAEYAARTIRPKIKKQLNLFLEEFELPQMKHIFPSILKKEISESCINKIDLDDLKIILKNMTIDHTVKPSLSFYGGEQKANEYLSQFIHQKLCLYLESSSPAVDYCSGLSPYLHFGQISPVYIVKEIEKAILQNPDLSKAGDAFLEQLIIRRELSMNYIYYNKDYDSFDGMTEPWAYKTMQEHLSDPREYIYTIEELEYGRTHDCYWNAAMFEMVQTGYMHNYMRMYWAKKVLEWSKTPESAYQTIVYLNNKYFLDGRDANSFAGIAWCFGKHDRAWTSRNIFGKLRYMNQNGLLRKFEMDDYIKRVDNMKGNYTRNTVSFLF